MTSRTRLVEQVAADGFAVMPRFMPGIPSGDAIPRIGVIDVVDGLDEIQTLKPYRAEDAPPNTYSGNFGTAEFPLHTDLAHWATPPRFFALRCVRGASNVVTHLLDGKTLTANLGLERLRRALVQPRRPMSNGKQLLRLLERGDELDAYMLRWDCLYLRPATPWSESAFEATRDYLSCASTINVILHNPGDTLIIDNWRMLHGRSPAPIDAHGRRIDRSYLKELR